MYICIYVYTNIYLCRFMNACIYMYVYVYICIYMYIYLYIFFYRYIHICAVCSSAPLCLKLRHLFWQWLGNRRLAPSAAPKTGTFVLNSRFRRACLEQKCSTVEFRKYLLSTCPLARPLAQGSCPPVWPS